jgi:hypothetical protein
MQMVAESQLKFQSWADNYDYSLARFIPDEQDPLRKAIESLSPLEQWRCVELLGQSLARHFFLVCHSDRPETDYTIDFTGDAWLDYVPSLRPSAKIVGERLARPGEDAIVRSLTFSRFGRRVELDAFKGTMFRQIDGKRSIFELLDNEKRDPAKSRQRVEKARAFFQRMADLDHLLFEIR